MPKHRHNHGRSRKRTRSRSPSSRQNSEGENSPKRVRKDQDDQQEDILHKILSSVEHLSSRVEALETNSSTQASLDERDTLSVIADSEDMAAFEGDSSIVESNKTSVEPIKAPVEPIKAPVDTTEEPKKPEEAAENTSNTQGQMYDPDATTQTWNATPAFEKFLETNFRRKLSYDQVLDILEHWSSPKVEALTAPKADQQVLNQVPSKMKKFVQERDKEMYTVQRAMLNATAPICSLHDALETGDNPSVDEIKTILEQALCLLGSANHQLSCLRRQRILSSINRSKINLADQPLPNAKAWLFGEDFPSIASKQAELSRGLAKNLNQTYNKGKGKYANNSSKDGRNRSGFSSNKYSSSGYSNYQGGSEKYQPRSKNRPFRPSKGRQADSQDT